MDWFDLTSADTKSAELAIKRVLLMSSDPHNIFTPFELCKEIVEKIPSVDGTNLVVANLEFVYTMKKRGADVSRLYFATPCLVKMKAARSILPASNVFKYETVISEKDVGGMKFDVVIGNPPYQEGDTGSNKTLFDKFYHVATELSARHVVFVAPTMWLTSNKKRLINLRNFLCDNGLVSVHELNAQRVFGVNVNMLGYTIQDKEDRATTYTFHREQNNAVVCAKYDAPVLTSDTLTLSILEKVSTGDRLGAVNSQLRGVSREGTCSNGEASNVVTPVHPFKMINKVNGGVIEYAWTKVTKNKHAGKVRVAFGDLSSKGSLGTITILTDVTSTTSRSVVYIPVDTIDMGVSLKSYLESKLFRFVLPLRRPGTNNAVGLLNALSRPPLDRVWTDEELYQYYNLTHEEIDIIEVTTK